MSKRGKTAIVAVGGNSLIIDEQHQSIPDQYGRGAVVALRRRHGRGRSYGHPHSRQRPQVGFILRRSGIAKGLVPEVPVDYADADTQGAIGYMFQRALYNEFKRRGLRRNVVTIITQVLVDRDDPALVNPTKPIGGYMDGRPLKAWRRISDGR
jgi:carbamate kinase